MPIAKMKRLQVLALERDHDALLRQLERMGCVEISEPDAPDARRGWPTGWRWPARSTRQRDDYSS